MIFSFFSFLNLGVILMSLYTSTSYRKLCNSEELFPESVTILPKPTSLYFNFFDSIRKKHCSEIVLTSFTSLYRKFCDSVRKKRYLLIVISNHLHSSTLYANFGDSVRKKYLILLKSLKHTSSSFNPRFFKSVRKKYCLLILPTFLKFTTSSYSKFCNSVHKKHLRTLPANLKQESIGFKWFYRWIQQTTMPGYPKEIFTDGKKLHDRLLCVICKLVLKNAVQSTCGHRFCDSCVKEKLENG